MTIKHFNHLVRYGVIRHAWTDEKAKLNKSDNMHIRESLGLRTDNIHVIIRIAILDAQNT